MTELVTINVAKDFSRTPGGRYIAHGPASGEEFRQKLLIPNLQAERYLVVELDGAWGYPASFLEEAFGGVVREMNWSAKEFFKHIRVVGTGAFSMYVKDVEEYVKEAAKAR